MNRLTHQRVNGIKQGYWTAAKKDELAERLAAYEDTGLTPEEIINGKMLRGWIPCSERLPEKSGWYLVTVELLDGRKETNMTLYTPKNMWMLSCNETQVLAWQPLPEPWEGDKE